jgi:hypothetical protein
MMIIGTDYHPSFQQIVRELNYPTNLPLFQSQLFHTANQLLNIRRFFGTPEERISGRFSVIRMVYDRF